MTTFLPNSVTVAPGVYAPQQDSLLLIEAMQSCADVAGRTVLDVCTGSGVVAIAAAQLGAAEVSAVDVCRRAVRCARANAKADGARVDVRRGTWVEAGRRGPYDVVVANPPYVPTAPSAQRDSAPSAQRDSAPSAQRDRLPGHIGPARAWDAGPEGRLVLDPLCAAAADLVAPGGAMLLVQSEFADPGRSIRILRQRMRVDVVMTRTIPFGPVLTARAGWMERAGLLAPGRREEDIIVIRAEKP